MKTKEETLYDFLNYAAKRKINIIVSEDMNNNRLIKKYIKDLMLLSSKNYPLYRSTIIYFYTFINKKYAVITDMLDYSNKEEFIHIFKEDLKNIN